MHKICTTIDCISKKCKRYARNMPKICLNMHIICRYTFQFYAIANLDKTSLKYAGICQ